MPIYGPMEQVYSGFDYLSLIQINSPEHFAQSILDTSILKMRKHSIFDKENP